jgi:hypothetical protein
MMPQTKSLALSILDAAMPVTPPGPAVRDA